MNVSSPLTERRKLVLLCLACSKLHVACQPAFDFEAFTRYVAGHVAFGAWIALRAACGELDDSVTGFIAEHRIDFGFTRRFKRERRKTRMRHFRAFARQLIALRRIGIVHCETRDNRGMGLFLLNSHADRLSERELLAQLCAIARRHPPSLWTTRHAEIVAEMHRLDLRSVVARTYDGGTAALLVGPASWLNHSLRSGVVFTVGKGNLLKRKIDNKGLLFDAAGFRDRRELLIRYDSPGSASWGEATRHRSWYADGDNPDDNDNDNNDDDKRRRMRRRRVVGDGDQI